MGNSMKKILTPVLFAFLLSGTLFAQDSLDYSMLTPPASPAFTLMGIAPSAVERPGSVTDFAVTILNTTNNLTGVPQDFSMEFAPYWLFGGGKNLSFDEYSKNGNVESNFLQTLSVSVATSASDDGDITSQSMGIGIRFSLAQGTISNDFTELREKMSEYNEIFAQRFLELSASDEVKKTLEAQLDTMVSTRSKLRARLRNLPDDQAEQAPFIEGQIEYAATQILEISQKIEARNLELQNMTDARKEEAKKALREELSKIEIKRTGLKLDVAGGLILDFPGQDFDSGKLSKAGVWVNGGYETESLAFLGVVRYLGDEANEDDSSLDFGARIVFDHPKFKKFDFSGETVYRNYFDSEVLDNNFRVALIFNYTIARNKKLEFTFGRDFEGNTTGNLLSMINLVLGFGSERPF